MPPTPPFRYPTYGSSRYLSRVYADVPLKPFRHQRLICRLEWLVGFPLTVRWVNLRPKGRTTRSSSHNAARNG